MTNWKWSASCQHKHCKVYTAVAGPGPDRVPVATATVLTTVLSMTTMMLYHKELALLNKRHHSTAASASAAATNTASRLIRHSTMPAFDFWLIQLTFNGTGPRPLHQSPLTGHRWHALLEGVQKPLRTSMATSMSVFLCPKELWHAPLTKCNQRNQKVKTEGWQFLSSFHIDAFPLISDFCWWSAFKKSAEVEQLRNDSSGNPNQVIFTHHLGSLLYFTVQGISC